MFGLVLKKLKIVSCTNDGEYFTEIPFSNGLTVIRAENSSGKSTCINAIAYGLGLDNILGPSRNRPFPRSMYRTLEASKDDENSLTVIQSYVELTVQSINGRVKLRREVQGDAQRILVSSEKKNEDFFLGSAGNIGSAKSSNGFHYWLEKFIGWDLPHVAKHDGTESKLYLECIYPLFFIEQKRGWSEFQANIPSFYGIKNLKKAAIEFCLGIENFNRQNRIVELNNQIDSYVKKWESLQYKARSLAEFGNVIYNTLMKLDVNEYVSFVDYLVPQKDISISLENHISKLEVKRDGLLNEITKQSSSEEFSSLVNEKIAFEKKLFELNTNFENLTSSVTKIDEKIISLDLDLDRYKQLKRLRDVGSEKELDTDFQSCPICGSEIDNTLNASRNKVKPLSIVQNIAYLDNQMNFFKGIRENHLIDIDKYLREIRLVEKRLEATLERINRLKRKEEQYLEIYGHTIREKIEIESEIKVFNKLLKQQNEINSEAKEIHKKWLKDTVRLKEIKKNKIHNVSIRIVNDLLQILKDNLLAFGFKSADTNHIRISPNTLRPELDGYDIVADSSASDYIRIIWSYTLAFAQIVNKHDCIKHGGFTVFDEPRQHETNKQSFESLINTVDSFGSDNGQVIIATSMNEDEFNKLEFSEQTSIKYFKDGEYILQKAE